MPITFFPHCDSRILHAPGECEHCDSRPEWQELREAWGIAFTGHDPEEAEWTRQLPCPADFNRPPGEVNDHRRWSGNVATSAMPIPQPCIPRVDLLEHYPTPQEQLREALGRLRRSLRSLLTRIN